MNLRPITIPTLWLLACACSSTTSPTAPADPTPTAAVGAVDAAAASRWNRPGFHVEEHDGRLIVLRSDDPELEAFGKTKELGKSVTRIGAGPTGMTVRAPDAETIDAYVLARPGFATRVKDGRIWVFTAGSADWLEFLKTGEPARSVTRIGVGPNGMTVRAPDVAVIDAWLAAL